MQHSKHTGSNLKSKITASLLSLAIIGTGTVPLVSTVVASAAEEDASVGASTVAIGTDNGKGVFWANATYYDYLSDRETKDGWRNPLQAGTGHLGSNNEWYPFYKLNREVIKAAADNDDSWTTPLYFGNFYNGDDNPYEWNDDKKAYQNGHHPGNINNNGYLDATNNYNVTRFDYAANCSNGLTDEHQSYKGLVKDTLVNNKLMVTDKTAAPYFDESALGDLAKVFKSSFPFTQEPHSDYTKYSFVSSSNGNQTAEDNVYFTYDAEGNPTAVNYGYGAQYAVKDGRGRFMYDEPTGYGIFPFNTPSTSYAASNGKSIYVADYANWDSAFVYAWDSNGNGEWFAPYYAGTLSNGTRLYEFTQAEAGSQGGHLSDKNGGMILAKYNNFNGTTPKSGDRSIEWGKCYYTDNLGGGTGTINGYDREQNLDYGFGVRMDVKFRVPGEHLASDGKTVVPAGKSEDGTRISFDFAGDDDLWMFITDNTTGESQLVLDMGGNHKKSTGHVYFDTLESVVDNVYTGQKKTNFEYDYSHTYTMSVFYMERGLIESNCDMSFTMTPLGNNFIVTEKINTTKVNSGLKDDVTGLSSFTFQPSQNGTTTWENGLSYNLNGANHYKSGKNTIDLKTDQYFSIANFFNINDEMLVKQTHGDSVLKYSTEYVYKNNTTGKKIGEGSYGPTDDPIVTEAGYLSNTGTASGDPYEFAELQADFVNTPRVADVTLSKETLDFIRQSLDAGDKGQSDEFPITVGLDFGGANGPYYDFEYTGSTVGSTEIDLGTADKGKLTIHDGETITIPNVPVGTRVTVSETLTENFDKNEFKDSASFTVTENGGSTAITNIRKAPDPITDKVKVDKTIFLKGADENPATLGDGYKFELYYEDTKIDDVTIRNTASDAGSAEFRGLKFTVDEADKNKEAQGIFYIEPNTFKDGRSKTFTFTVKEALTDEQKKVIDAPDDQEVDVTIYYDKVRNILTNIPPEQIGSVPDPDYTSDFENPYKVADLQIYKLVTRADGGDLDEQDLSKEFDVEITFTFNSNTFPNGVPVYYSYSDGEGMQKLEGNTLKLKNERTITIPGLPVGTHVKITETSGSEYTATYTPASGEVDIVEQGTVPVSINVENKRQAPGEAPVSVKKVLENADIAAKAGVTIANGGFKYTLTETTSATSSYTETVTGTSATVNFTPIRFEHAGTRTFTIVEVPGNDTNIVYDNSTINVSITASNGTSGLEITEIKYTDAQGKELTDPTFTNKYKEGAVAFMKTVADKSSRLVESDTTKFPATVEIKYPGQNEFSVQPFTMEVGKYPDYKNPKTVKVTDGKVEIEHLYAYLIKGLPIGTEVKVTETDSKGYLVYYFNGQVMTAAELTDNASVIPGTVSGGQDYISDGEPSPTVMPANAVMVLNQKVELPVDIEAKKAAEGFALKDFALKGEYFEFTLTGEGVSQTKKNDAQGNVKFDAITFEVRSDNKATDNNTIVIKPDQFTDDKYTAEYTIAETRGNNAFLTYDGTEYKATVTVTRTPRSDVEGLYTYAAAVDYGNATNATNTPPTFTNSWKKAPVKIVKAVKNSEGRAYETDKTFDIDVTFTYPEGYTGAKYDNQTITLGKDNDFTKVFTDLPYGTKVAVNEQKTQGFTASYDPTAKFVTVGADSSENNPVTITVTNTLPGDTSFPVQFKKQFTNGASAADLVAGAFEAEIIEGTALAGKKVTNDANGVFDFGTVKVKYVPAAPARPAAKTVYLTDSDFTDDVATIVYKAKETNAGKAYINYDGSTLTYTVKIKKTTDDVKTTLSVLSATYDNDNDTFVNTVKTGDITITKNVLNATAAEKAKPFKADVQIALMQADGANAGTLAEYKAIPFIYTYEGGATEATTTLDLYDGRVYTLSGLPIGSKVKVTEQADKYPNYTVAYAPQEVEVGGTTTLITVNNTLQKPGTATPVVNKDFTRNAELAGLDSTFKDKYTYNFNLSYTGSEFSYNKNASINGKNGWTATFDDITFPPELDYTGNGKNFEFLMKETSVTAAEEGGKVDENIVVDTDTFTLAYNVKQGKGTTGLVVTGPTITKHVAGQEDTEVQSATFFNGYQLGDVKVVKAFEDYDGSAIDNSVVEGKEFSVTLTAAYPNGTTMDFQGKIGLNKAFEVEDLPRDTKVTVTEDSTNGMTLKSIEPAEITIGKTAQLITVTNKRTKLNDTEVKIGARKYLEGSPINQNDPFKFTLTGEYKDQKIEFNAQNAGDVIDNNGQAVIFAPVKFTLDESKKAADTIYLAKTDFDEAGKVKIQFTVTEVPDNRADIKFDSKLSRTVNVEVTRTETADAVSLTAGVTDAQAPEFTNTKLGKVGFNKTVINYDGNEYTPNIDFLFTVSYTKNGEPVKKDVTINVGDDKTDNDSFISEYLPVGTVVTIEETDSKGFNVNTKTTTLTVADQTDPVTFTFVNTHPEARGTEIKPTVDKILEGATLKEGEFLFKLTGDLFGTKIEETKTNDANGKVEFSTIKFSLEKDEPGAIKLTKAMFKDGNELNFELKVSEVPADRVDIEYPVELDQYITGYVELIEEDAEASINAVVNAEAHQFTNIQLGRAGFTKDAKDINGASFKPDTDFIFKAEYLDGTTWKVLDENIVINLGDADSKNDSYETKYLPVGTTVKFTETDTKGFENNDKVKTVDVALEQDGKFATVSFTNNRPVPGTTTATLTAEKILKGAQLGNGDFSFYISGEGAAANKEYKNVGKNITFDTITYKYSKTDSEKTSGSTVVLHDSDFTNGKAVREYTITEKNTGLNDVIYAANTVKGVVTITKTETASDITLKADVTYPGGKSFTNEIRKGSVKIIKTNQSDEKVDGITFKLFKVTSNDLSRTEVLNSTFVDDQTTVDGVAEFKDLDLYVDEYQNINNPTYQWYCIAETDPGKDYNLNSGLTFFQVPTEDVYDLTFEYMNGKVITPTSGGEGMFTFKLVGSILLAFASVLLAGYVFFSKKSGRKSARHGVRK